ncbi:MAG: acyl-CoA dehydrogenase [Arenicellales bacterium]|jgi:acyl-CoA dehydrogenase|nr:acyl-CoA dehydrogenase [Arenicellales bacterium]MDP6949044.1 acyl-CoA dehydrogenase [Arenicellales bacterium]
MPNYTAPLADLRFALKHLARIDEISTWPGFEEASPDLVDAILTEAGKFASNVLAPLNRAGDTEGSVVKDGVVTTPAGWKEAYMQFSQAGWIGLMLDPEYGGQGLPRALGTAVQEMWDGANMSFGLCPMLSQTAAEAINLKGSAAQKALYLPRLISGEWSGTMNLTEPQAGSDLAAVRTSAEPTDQGYHLISGQKIFITYGEHDLTSNIIHLVLARTPGAPAGIKGISLFIVPKFIPSEDGEPGKRNDVYCVSLEHKLGIHASPTAVLSYGDNGGAVGYLVGEENRGLEYMFIMMNRARHAVGIESYGIAERASQRALAFARERVQGRAVGDTDSERSPIIRHPDVQRMLLSMQSRIQAMRALSLYTAAAADRASHHPDAAEQARGQRAVDVLTPVVKGWGAEVGNDITGVALQVHGGMGYIEETGAAQHYRDARITTIYEGTTGIQAADLVGRKMLRDGGQMVGEVIETMRVETAAAASSTASDVQAVATVVARLIEKLAEATDWLLAAAGRDPRVPLAGSFSYLMLWGITAGGWQMAQAAVAARRCLDADEGDSAFYRAKLASCSHYASQVLPHGEAYASAIIDGGVSLENLDSLFA